MFTIRRGLPNTIDTREESRHSSRSQGFSTQHEKCPLRWLSIGVGLGMGEEGEEPRDDLDGSSTHSFAPLCSSPSSHRRVARVERPSAKERGKRGKSREGLRHIAFAPLCSSPSSHRRFARVERPGARAKSQSQEAEPRARAKSLRSIASWSQSRRIVPHTHTYFPHMHIHAHAHTLVYLYFETYK